MAMQFDSSNAPTQATKSALFNKASHGRAHTRGLSIGGLLNAKPTPAKSSHANTSLQHISEDGTPKAGTITNRSARSNTIVEQHDAIEREISLIQQLSDQQQSTDDDLLNLSELDPSLVDTYMSSVQQDAIMKEALDSGIDLRVYSKQVEDELLRVEHTLIDEYLAQADEMNGLHTELSNCDTVLSSMSEMLSKFQHELTSISTEISTLQLQSSGLQVKLHNRQSAEALLTNIVDSLYITDDLIHTIIDGDIISDQFLHALKALDQRLDQYQQFRQTPTPTVPTKCLQEMEPVLNRLKLKALQRIRSFLMEKFYELQRPRCNVIAEQSALIVYRYYQQFATKHGNNTGAALHDSTNNSQATTPTSSRSARSMPPPSPSTTHNDSTFENVGNEIRTAYVEAMRTIYSKKFRSYIDSLKRCQKPEHVWKSDVLGAETSVIQTSNSSFFSSSNKKSLTELNAVFQLHNRLTILRSQEILIPPPASAVTSAKSTNKYSFEEIYCSMQQLLIESVNAEHSFLLHFFSSSSILNSPTPKHGDTATATAVDIDEVRWSGMERQMFESIFNKVLAMYVEYVQEWLQSSHDVLAQLALLRIIQLGNARMQHPALNTYYDKVNMLLWPKWKQTFDAHVQSVIQMTHIQASPNATHWVCLRYALLISAILALSSPGSSSTSSAVGMGTGIEMLDSNCIRLRLEMEKLLTRSAARLNPPKNQLVFLIKQYHSIRQLVEEQAATISADASRLNGAEAHHWQQLCAAQISAYVEQELAHHFPKMIQFVQRSEQSAADAANTSAVQEINQQFTNNYQAAIEALHKTISAEFAMTVPTNPTNHGPPPMNLSLEVLRQTLVQLMLYYQRYVELVRRNYKQQPQLIASLLPTNQLLFAVKKYTA